MTQPFYMLPKSAIEDVRMGKMTIEEFGVLCGFACLVNPYNGYLLGNFSSIGNEFGLDANKAKYICGKLQKLERLYFIARQGLRNFHFFVVGLQMATLKGERPRFVSKEYIQNFLENSEVENKIQKSKSPKTRDENFNSSSQVSEVPYIKTEKEIKNKNEKKSEITPESLSEIFCAIASLRGEDKARKYFEEHNYPIPEI